MESLSGLEERGLGSAGARDFVLQFLHFSSCQYVVGRKS